MIKNIALFLFTIFSLSFYGQYSIEVQLDSITKKDKLVLLYNDEVQDVIVEEDDWGFLLLKNNQGKVAVSGRYDLEKITWIDSVINPDANYSGEILYDNSLLITKSKDGYGLIDYYTQEEVLPSNNDSILLDDDYSEAVAIYKNGKKAIFPLQFLSDSNFQEHLIFYDEIECVVQYFNDYWDDESAFLVKENNKYGVMRYSVAYDEGSYAFSYSELVPAEMDSIYYLEDSDEYFIVQKDENKGVFSWYNLSQENSIKLIYSNIYFDKEYDDLVKIASLSIMQKKFPNLLSLEVFDATKNIIKFKSTDGTGLYWEQKDSLLLPMIYQDISLHSRNKVEVKKDNKYAYVHYDWFDYEFIGLTNDAYYLYNRPLSENFFKDNDTSIIYFKGDSLMMISEYGKEEVVYDYNYNIGELKIDDILKGITDWEKQRKILFKSIKEYRNKSNLYNLGEKYDNLLYNRIGNNEIIIYAQSWGEIDSIVTVENLDEKYTNPRIEFIGKEKTMPNYLYINNWKTKTYNFYKDDSTRIILNGKNLKGDHITYIESGYFSVYNKGKTKIYNQKGELVKKLKKNQTFLYAVNDYISIENWKYGDTTAVYQILNPKGKVILEKQKTDIKNGIWDSSRESFRYAIDSSYVKNENPLEFVYNKNKTQLIIRTNNCFPCDPSPCNFKQEYFDLHGSKLDVDYIDGENDFKTIDELIHDYFVFIKTTHRAHLHGIHTGEKWIVPAEYDFLQEMEMVDENSKEVYKFFKVGNKNIFNFYDLNGNRLLNQNFYLSRSINLVDEILELEIIPEGGTEYEKIKVQIER